MRQALALTSGLLLLISLLGCAPKLVTQINGYPLPKEFDLGWSSDRSLAAQWFFVRWHPKKIESRGFSEFIEQPDYLTPDAPHNLAADTQAVVVNLHVMNPKRKKYRLVKVVTVGGTTWEEPVAPWTIREHLNLVVPGPLPPGKEVTIAVKILSGEKGRVDEPMLSTGELHYRVRVPQNVAAGKDQKEDSGGAFSAALTAVAPDAKEGAVPNPTQAPPVVKAAVKKSKISLAPMLSILDRSGTRIEVENGNGIKNDARETGNRLLLDGFNVVNICNHIDFNLKETVITYRPKAALVAKTLASKYFPGAELQEGGRLSQSVDIRISLGRDRLGDHKFTRGFVLSGEGPHSFTGGGPERR